MEPYVAALIALLGTLTVAFIGFYQWRKKRLDDDASATRQPRRKAYQDLWVRLEEINIKLRESASNPSLFSLLKEVNEFFLRNSLWFKDGEQKLINEYVNALDRLRVAVYEKGSADVVHAYQRTWFEMPAGLSAEIKGAEEAVAQSRGKIKSFILRAQGT